MIHSWLAALIFSSIGFVLAFILLSHINGRNSSPTSSLAWLISFVLVPVISVPAYLIFGGRLMMLKARTKVLQNTSARRDHPDEAPNLLGPYLNQHGVFESTMNRVNNIFFSGSDFFCRLLEGIRSAEFSIDFSSYELLDDDSGRMIVQELIEKCRNGVRVRLLVDAVGSIKAPKKELMELKAAGGEYTFFMPMPYLPYRGRANLRNHRKIYLIDETVAFIGGMNLCEHSLGSRQKNAWEDMMLELEGGVVHQLLEVFQSDWSFSSKEKEGASAVKKNNISVKRSGSKEIPIQLIESGPDVKGEPLHELILSLIFGAEKSVDIVTPYFVPDELTHKALIVAAHRGVNVRIIIPKHSNRKLADLARESYLTTLSSAGIKLLLCPAPMLHAKILIIDGKKLVAGSANMDMRSFFLNYEISGLIDSCEISSRYLAWMSDLESRCEAFRQDTRYFKDLVEGTARLLAPML